MPLPDDVLSSVSDRPDLALRLAAMRRHGDALAIAIRVCDQVATLVSSARLRRELARLTTAATALIELRTDLRTEVDGLVRAARNLLDVAQHHLAGNDHSRLLGWADTILTADPAFPLGPDLYELDASMLDQAGVVFAELYLAQCRFSAAAIPAADFDSALLERCDFSRASLPRSTWTRTRVTRCCFSGAMLADTTLDEACFTDCDFRGADLGAVKRGSRASAVRTSFVRCDLRETRWQLRHLDRARFVECKLAGAHGPPLTESLVIERCDLSVTGDGSQIATPADVLIAWSSG